MRRSILVAAALGGLVLLALLIMGVETVQAAWVAGGVPACADTAHQDFPIITGDGAGGAFIAWVDWRHGNTAVYLQRITDLGTIASGWPADGVRVSSASANLYIQGIEEDGSGGVFVLFMYEDPTFLDKDVYLQRITASGTVASGWPATGHDVVAAIDDQFAATMIPDGSGGVIVAWLDERDGVNKEVYAQKVNGSGVDQWLPAGGKAVTSGVDVWSSLSLAPDGAGGAYIAWDWLGLGGYIHRLNSGGNAVSGWPAGGTAFGNPGSSERDIWLAPDGAGGVILAWTDGLAVNSNDIYALRLTSSGSTGAGWTSTGELMCYEPTANQSTPHVISDDTGGAILVWHDLRKGDGDIYAQRVSAAGDTLWGASGLPLATQSNDEFYPQLARDGEGGAFFTWYESGSAPNHTVFAQHVVADGRIALPEGGLGIGDLAYSQGWPAIAFVDTHSAIMTFSDPTGLFSSKSDIYAQYVDGLSNFNAWNPYPGWSSSLVPRNQPVPGGWVAQVTPVLDGNLLTTYVNWSGMQEGPAPNPTSWFAIWLDEEEDLGGGYLASTNPLIHYVLVDEGPLTIRGGRHALGFGMDPYDQTPETHEDDNSFLGQWIWSPLTLIENNPVVREPPPNRGNLTLPNTDGMFFDRHPDWAWVVAAAPLHPDDDFDLWVYDDYTGSTAGFSNALGVSQRSAGYTDFVVGHYNGTPLNLYPGVERYDMNGGEPYVMDQTDGAGRNAGEEASFLYNNLPPGRLVDVYEALLTAGTTYYFSLYRVSGLSDLAFEIFPADPGGVWVRDQGGLSGSMEVTADLDTLVVTPGADGWYPIVVYRSWGPDALESEMVYNLTWSRSVFVDVPGDTPPNYTLAFQGPYPNPMTDNARLRFTLAEKGRVRLSVFDLRGRHVVSLVDETLEAGPHATTWDGRAANGSRVGPGIYWAQLQTGGEALVKRVVVLR